MASQTDCLLKAVEAIRKNKAIPAEEIDQIVAGLHATIEKNKGRADKQFLQAILRVAHADKQAVVAAAIKKVDDLKVDELGAKFSQMTPEEAAQALRNLVEYDGYNRPVAEAHLYGKVRSLEEATLGKLYNVWENIYDSRFGLGRDSDVAVNFNKELRGVDTGDAQAKALVTEFREVMSPILERLRKAGVPVVEMKDWAPQNHDIAKIQSDIRGWKAFMAKALDPRHHPDAESTSEGLLDTLSRRGIDEELRKQVSAQRQIFFRTPDLEYEYNLRFGEDGFSEGLYNQVRLLARQAAIAEQFAPNAARNVEKLAETIRARAVTDTNQLLEQKQAAQGAGNAAEVKRIDSRLSRLAKLIERPAGLPTELDTAVNLTRGLVGEFSSPDSQTLADVFGATRNWGRTVLLGKVALGLLGEDGPRSLIRSRLSHGGFMRGTMAYMRAQRQLMTEPQARVYAQRLGGWQHALHMANSFRQTGMVDALATSLRPGDGSMSAKARQITARSATVTQTISGAQLLEKNMRSAFLMQENAGLADQLRERAWSDLDAGYKTTLEANAINESRWRELQRVAQYRDSNIGGGLATEALPQHLHDIVMSLLYRQADMAVTYPGLYDRYVLTRDTRPGTWQGEALRSSFQFWSVPVAIWRGTLRDELRRGKGTALAFVTASVAASVATMQLYTIFNDDPAYARDDSSLWLRGVARSGILVGPVGDVVVGGWTSLAERGRIETPTSPSAMLAFDTIAGVSQASMLAMDDETDKAAARLLRTVDQTMIPNIWYLDKALVKPAINSAIEHLDPAYLARKRQRQRREGREPE